MNVAGRAGHPAGQLAFADRSNAAHLSRLTKAGKAMRLAPGVYAVGATLPPDRVAYHFRFALINYVWPGAVLCDRTALAGGEPVDGWLFVCHPDPPRAADLVLPSLSVAARVGPGPLPGDMPMPYELYLSGPARGLVENIRGRGRPASGRPHRAAGAAVAEDRLDTEARTGGAGRIRNLLAQLDVVGPQLPTAAVDVVRSRLTALLGTASTGAPVSERLRARLSGQPYDQRCLNMFTSFAALLTDTAPVPRPAVGPAHRWEWLPFFEAYFSNFIEGTQFSVGEARRIAIDGQDAAGRPQDSHDISATFRIAADAELSSTTPRSGDHLLELLHEQHHVLLSARPDKRPGMFKQQPNYAGGYAFVQPDLVVGTLLRGFDAFSGVTDAFQRAAALMLLVAECHPFDDGNGRMARLIANSELSAAGQIRIVLPTVYRNNYLAALAGVSNGAGRGEALLAVLAFAQKWTSYVDWSSYELADRQMTASNAYLDSGAAELAGIRLRLPS